ncbi:MAG: glycosyltransferase family 4 protein [Deltaproteobacteria bacterium]|nr:glycosyltransferase family 4 protein [Deltaproteobacteria bacterium]
MIPPSLRIVLVFNEAPLPDGNAAAKWYYVLLKGLVERGHRVTSFISCDAQQERDLLKYFPSANYDLRVFRRATRSGLIGKIKTIRRPYSYLFSTEFETNLTKELALGFDVLHLESLWSGWVGLNFSERSLINFHFLHHIDSSKSRVLGLRNRLLDKVTKRSEYYLLNCYNHIATVSSRLSQSAKHINPSAHVHIIPIALELSRYPFEKNKERPKEFVVGLVGSFNWRPSYWAGHRLIEKLWPTIKSKIPQATLKLVGWNAKQAFLPFINDPSISIVEDVSDIQPHFTEISVFLFPLETGSGMKVKLLEAFALGVPVVTTPEGIEGLPVVDGMHAGVSDDNEGLVQRVIELYNDREKWNRYRHAARELVQSHCSSERAMLCLEHAYLQILHNKVI